MRFRPKKWLIKIIIFLFTMVILSPVFVVEWGKKHVYLDTASVAEYPVAIVFGAGIRRDGLPQGVLKDRLLTAAQLYNQGSVKKILVSGDNQVEDYNEPEAMFQYLTKNLSIPQEDVIRDFGGRRTYDTCVRAHEIWGAEEAVLITQGYHLPRALLLCNGLRVKSHGIAANKQEYVRLAYFKFREIFAIYNALFDLFVWPPDYIGGERLNDLNTGGAGET